MTEMPTKENLHASRLRKLKAAFVDAKTACDAFPTTTPHLDALREAKEKADAALKMEVKSKDADLRFLLARSAVWADRDYARAQLEHEQAREDLVGCLNFAEREIERHAQARTAELAANKPPGKLKKT